MGKCVQFLRKTYRKPKFQTEVHVKKTYTSFKVNYVTFSFPWTCVNVLIFKQRNLYYLHGTRKEGITNNSQFCDFFIFVNMEHYYYYFLTFLQVYFFVMGQKVNTANYLITRSVLTPCSLTEIYLPFSQCKTNQANNCQKEVLPSC